MGMAASQYSSRRIPPTLRNRLSPSKPQRVRVRRERFLRPRNEAHEMALRVSRAQDFNGELAGGRMAGWAVG